MSRPSVANLPSRAPAADPSRRFARPRIRQRRTRDGRRCWIYDLSCRCGWTEVVAGTGLIALAAADAHWHAAHRTAWRCRNDQTHP
jgi:hypothetical protein